MDNEELIKRLKQRDEQAFRRLVEQQKDRVFNTCLGFLRHRQDAEDVAQEVFLQVLDSIDSFREDASVETWIYRIAVTKSLGLTRQRKRKKRRMFFEALRSSEKAPDEIPVDDCDTHPGIALEQKERAEILFREIDRLSDNQRAAFILHKVEGLAYKEIADVMETTLPAVEALIHRARKNLEQQLYEYYRKNEL